MAVIGLMMGAATSMDTSPDSCASSEAATAGPCSGPGDQAPAAPFTGPDGLVDDPTSGGRITRRMLHTYGAVQQAFGGWPWGISCWDPHTWNPTSDHPRGRACDFTVGHIGVRPSPAARDQGWQLAHWIRANAEALGISYVIWDGHIWSLARSHESWRPYNGGGIYDPESITAGHEDHVHVSLKGS
jgi:hypothetical protein